jgi:eukaryotic-like serine/threonine-protein kinase
LARRLPSQPPVLPGFSHVHILGSGGFADVFLYAQNMPRRQVAVKVLLNEVVNDQVRQMFQAEANLMAQLCAHPSILTVYQASVSADGRPYLVMELCSASLSARYRSERIPVPEVLRIAVRIGSAIETAHRAGVLHRDIKPSNILMTAYGHPVLADFGIAATVADSREQEMVGMSIPWSAPEVLMDETPGSIQSEVWSLAATVYSLLAGRSPFEIPGDPNKSTDLISRINRGRPQPIARTDVPASLEKILANAMSRKPENRPATVLELIRSFQLVETELGVAQTQIEVAVDDWALATVADLEDRTRVRGVAGALVRSNTGRRRRRRIDGQASSVGTLVRETAGARTSASPPTSRSRSRGSRILIWGVVVLGVLALALGGTAVFVLARSNSGGIPVVANIVATQHGTSVKFSWANPGLASHDSYQISTTDGASSTQGINSFVVDGTAGEHVCITVTVIRAGKTGQSSQPKCVDLSA